MPAAYTIRIFVAEGDPEGVRIIDRFNWTGKGVFFPRQNWNEVRKRPEFKFAGVYILFGDGPSENDLPTVYIGESDGIGDASSGTTTTRTSGRGVSRSSRPTAV